MVHLRIVAPPDRADRVYAMLCETASAIDVIRVPDASTRPDGDLIMCDVAREDASVIISDLQATSGIAPRRVDLAQPDGHDLGLRHRRGRARAGLPADAVIWEELDQRTSESVELSAVFLLYMVLAAIIAAIGIFLDSAILVVGAMVVGPEFGPIAGRLRRDRPAPRRSSRAARRSRCVVGFALAIGATMLATLAFDGADIVPDDFDAAERTRWPASSRARTRSRSSSPSAPARRAC